VNRRAERSQHAAGLGESVEIDTMGWIRSGLHQLARNFGYELVSRNTNKRDLDLAEDLKEFVADPKVIFDVGAHKGQSTRFYRGHFPGSEIHAFEPDPDLFKELSTAMHGQQGVTLNNVALGSTPGPHRFFVISDSHMNSLLEPGPQIWGTVTRETTVEVVTLGDYCAGKGIESIGLLKIDTQGYDLEVLKGARRLLEAGRISLVLTEILFADMYKDSGKIEDVFRLMREHRYKLSTFYNWHYRRHAVAGFCDALFVHSDIVPP
jgi:FkbM family methyltransferase